MNAQDGQVDVEVVKEMEFIRIADFIQVNGVLWILRKMYGDDGSFSVLAWDLETGKSHEVELQHQMSSLSNLSTSHDFQHVFVCGLSVEAKVNLYRFSQKDHQMRCDLV